jgi:hypothetical protein
MSARTVDCCHPATSRSLSTRVPGGWNVAIPPELRWAPPTQRSVRWPPSFRDRRRLHASTAMPPLPTPLHLGRGAGLARAHRPPASTSAGPTTSRRNPKRGSRHRTNGSLGAGAEDRQGAATPVALLGAGTAGVTGSDHRRRQPTALIQNCGSSHRQVTAQTDPCASERAHQHRPRHDRSALRFTMHLRARCPHPSRASSR